MIGKRIPLVLLVLGVLASLLYGSSVRADSRLAEAARQRDTQAVRTLLANQGKGSVDVNGALGDGTTALHWAAYNDDLELTQTLLHAGANPRVATRLGHITPLILACGTGSARVVGALVKGGAEVDASTENGVTPLMAAANAGNVPAIELLLDRGARIDAREAVHGQTALMFAAAKNRAGAIRTLIRHGADWKLTSIVEKLEALRFDEDGNPLRERPARARGSSEAASTEANVDTGSRASQIRLPANPNNGGDTTSSDVANAPRIASGAALAFARRASALAMGGNTALTLAAREGHMDAVRALIEAGVDVDAPHAGDQMPPIVVAICNGHYDLAMLLLEHGADPNRASVDGLAALYAVIDTQWAPVGWAPNPITDQEKNGYLKLMEALLKHGAQVNARLTKKLWFRPTHHDECWIGTAGATPFWRAAQATDLPAMRLLVEHGADPKIASNEGDNALMVAAGLGWNGNFSRQAPFNALDAVRYCLDLGLNPTLQDVQGYTALAGAAYRGDNELIKLLVEKGARLDTRNTRGWSVTDMANGPSLRSSVPVAHPYTVALLQKLGAPPLTPLEGEEILGIIRKRPEPKTDAQVPKANAPEVKADASEPKNSAPETKPRAPEVKADVAPLVEFEKMTWPELKRAIHEQGRTTVLIFNGGTEQRGPQGITAGHTFIARALGKEIALKLGNAIIAPVLPYSPNNASADLPGTVGISPAIYAAINQEVAEQMIVNGFKNVVLMGDHGGGQKELEEVAKRLDAKYASQGIRVVYCDDAYKKVDEDFNKWLVENGYPVGSHAGIKDTSEMLYLGGDQGWIRKELLPTAVGASVRKPGEPRTPGAKRETNGIVGDARRSSVEIGKRISDMKVDYAVKQIRQLLANRP